MTRRRRLSAIAVSVSFLFLVSVVAGVTFCIRYAEKQRMSVEASQSLGNVLPQVAETSSLTTFAVSATPASQMSQETWHAVGSWTGEYGSKETERFTIRGSEWRVSWKTVGGSSRSVCALAVYVYEDSGAFVTLAANRQGVSSDVSYVRAQPGQFYLGVISCRADWEIAVEDWY
jgi:Mn2+/Fe2+ NRAMP family transporter